MTNENDERTSETKPILEQKTHNKHKKSHIWSYLKGYIGGISVVATTSFSYVEFQYGSPDDGIPLFQCTFLRSVVTLLLLIPILYKTETNIKVSRSSWTILFAASCTYYISVTGFLAAEYYLPLGLITSLESCIVLISNIILDYIIFKRCKCHIIIASLVAIGSIVLITQPSPLDRIFSECCIFKSVKETHFQDVNSTTEVLAISDVHNETFIHKVQKYNVSDMGNVVEIGLSNQESAPEAQDQLGFLDRYIFTTDMGKYVFAISLVVASSLGLSAFYFILHVTGEAIPFQVINTWTAIFGLIVSTPLCLIFEDVQFPKQATNIALWTAYIICMSLYNIILFFTLKILTPNILALLETLRIAIMFVAQYTILRDINPGKQNWIEVAGGAIIFINSICVTVGDMIIAKTKENMPGKNNDVKHDDDNRSKDEKIVKMIKNLLKMMKRALVVEKKRKQRRQKC